MKICLLLAATLAAISERHYCAAFTPSSSLPFILSTRQLPTTVQKVVLKSVDDNHHPSKCELGRRTVLSTSFSIIASAPLLRPIISNAQDSKGKVVVYGGSGYVGAHVCSLLTQQGYDVTSISRSSPEAQLERSNSILGNSDNSGNNVQYISLDASKASQDELSTSMKDATAVISCVGISPGSQNQKDGNGLVNSRIISAAKAAGVPKVVYIGVSSALASGPAKFLLGDYFAGKATAEKSVMSEFGSDNSLIIKPPLLRVVLLVKFVLLVLRE